ncbi:hypothetical protein AYI70_g11926 [Smittium culicis]|uniref:Uncharacterized protein n=1 Tax=Smittium culicis TaxID=133412 RepID=A0A1R1WZP3_9FUNG|nr:hypothetical protein AYI70_g11926 [Smittium culicis]
MMNLAGAYNWTSGAISNLKSTVTNSGLAKSYFGIEIIYSQEKDRDITTNPLLEPKSQNQFDESSVDKCILTDDGEYAKSKIRCLKQLIQNNCPSLMNPNGTQAVFIPSSLIPTGDMQTIFCSYSATRNILDNVEYEREILIAEDGGTVSIDWTPPLSKEPLDDRPIAFILHGLTGGSFF